MIFRRRTPHCTRIAYEDIDVSQSSERLVGQAMNIYLDRTVRCDEIRFDAQRIQMRLRLLQFADFSSREHNARTQFAERLGELQTEAARAASRSWEYVSCER